MKNNLTKASLNRLIDEITEDAYGEDEPIWAFLEAFTANVKRPCGATVIGVPVSIIQFDYDGNPKRGLIAKCCRPDRTRHTVAVPDLVFPPGSEGERYVAAYRLWMGLSPFSPATPPPAPSLPASIELAVRPKS